MKRGAKIKKAALLSAENSAEALLVLDYSFPLSTLFRVAYLREIPSPKLTLTPCRSNPCNPEMGHARADPTMWPRAQSAITSSEVVWRTLGFSTWICADPSTETISC